MKFEENKLTNETFCNIVELSLIAYEADQENFENSDDALDKYYSAFKSAFDIHSLNENISNKEDKLAKQYYNEAKKNKDFLSCITERLNSLFQTQYQYLSENNDEPLETPIINDKQNNTSSLPLMPMNKPNNKLNVHNPYNHVQYAPKALHTTSSNSANTTTQQQKDSAITEFASGMLIVGLLFTAATPAVFAETVSFEFAGVILASGLTLMALALIILATEYVVTSIASSARQCGIFGSTAKNDVQNNYSSSNGANVDSSSVLRV